MAMTGGTAKLVKTGYGDGRTDFPIKLYVYYKTSQSVADNKSTITVGMYVTTPSGYPIGPWDDFNGSYVGTTSLTFDGKITNFSGTKWIVENKTFTVSHKDDGTGKATIYWKWGVNSSWGGFVNPSGSFEITLPTIARASVPTAASSAKMGDTLTINTNRRSTSFTHTLNYSFGGATGTIATGVGGSYTWTVPDLASKCNNALSGTCTITCITYSGTTKVGEKSVNVTLNVPSESTPALSATTVAMGSSLTVNTNRKSSNFTHKISYSFNGATGDIATSATTSAPWNVSLDLAKKIPSKPKGTGTITCTTYNGNKQVGTAKTVNFTATVPNNSTTQPTISAFSVTPSGSIPSFFDGLYIQGKTGVEASFTASSTYSTVSSYTLTVDGNAYNGGVFTSSGIKTVRGTVTDARGYSTTVSRTITVLPYSPPRLIPHSSEKVIVCKRCDKNGKIDGSGTYLRIKVGRSYDRVMSGSTQKNYCQVAYRYKTSGTTEYSYREILIPTSGAASEEVDVVIPNVVNSTSTSYDVQIVISDTMESRIEHTYVIPTSGMDFHLRKGGKGAAFGKFSEIENGVEFEWDVYGRAYGLGRLHGIPANSDLNDEKFLNFGCYGIKQLETAETIVNIPYVAAGILRVYSATGSGQTLADEGWIYIAQEFEPYYGEVIFRRTAYRRGTGEKLGFTPWKAVSGVDAIAESGTVTKSGVTWNYRKWFNGTAECWARRDLTVDATRQWGSLYYADVPSAALPFTFAEQPVCNMIVERGGEDAQTFFVALNGRTTTTATSSAILCRPNELTGTDVTMVYSVHGKWK